MNDVTDQSSSRMPLLVESSPALPLVAITVSQRTGATEDPPGKEGLSRMTGRLMRRTGAGMTAEALDERIDALGGSLGVDIGHSAASFHGTVISSSLAAFADVLVDVLSAPSLSDEELGRLKREAEAELVESRDNDRALARRWFRKKLFEGHPYSRPVSGTIESLRSITAEDVRRHCHDTIAKKNLVFAFAGDVLGDDAVAIADRVSAGLPEGAQRADHVPDPAMPPGRRLVLVDKPDRTQTQILIGGLGTHPHDEDHFALHVANTIFGGTFTARMSQEIRSKRGWSYGAYSSMPYDRRRRDFHLWTFPKAEDAAPCIRLQLEMLRAWRDKGVSKRELDWAKRYLARSHAFSVDTAAKRVHQSLDEVLYDLPARYHEDYVARVRAVSLDEVNASIQRRISTEDLLVTVVGTESQIGTSVRDAIDDLTSVEVVAYDTDA